MKQVFINRFYGNNKQTLGFLSVVENGSLIWWCKTLELAWNDNKPNISCIPIGSYFCRWSRSPLFSKKASADVYTYEVMDVIDRAGIRLHSANYNRDLLGCLALGSNLKDLDIDGQLDLIHSGDTMRKFEEIMEKKDFVLSIK